MALNISSITDLEAILRAETRDRDRVSFHSRYIYNIVLVTLLINATVKRPLLPSLVGGWLGSEFFFFSRTVYLV